MPVAGPPVGKPPSDSDEGILVTSSGVFLYRLSTPWVGLFGGVNGFCFVS